MHIVSGRVQAQSQHQFSHSEQQIRLRQQLASAPTAAPAKASSASDSSASETDSGLDKEMSLLKGLVEALTGKQIKTLSLNTAAPTGSVSTPTSPPAPVASSGRVLQVEATQVSESEITQVAFSGQFSTADGQQLSISLQYSLERSYSATTFSANVSSGKATDPLALNFNGQGVALDPRQTAFDLNSDGQAEGLATLKPGSAYLALDSNGDGKINNGKELFGPTSGDGFADLAKLDSDGNGFIDSADPLFSKLLLFRPGESTQALASKDVGAIFLGSAASPARLTDSSNQSLGQLRATGFYLSNSGSTGLVQQLDLTA